MSLANTHRQIYITSNSILRPILLVGGHNNPSSTCEKPLAVCRPPIVNGDVAAATVAAETEQAGSPRHEVAAQQKEDGGNADNNGEGGRRWQKVERAE